MAAFGAETELLASALLLSRNPPTSGVVRCRIGVHVPAAAAHARVVLATNESMYGASVVVVVVMVFFHCFPDV